MRTLNYIKQPNNRTCGQSTIAMLAGVSVHETIEIFGHSSTSYFRDYTKALKILGMDYSPWIKVDNRKKRLDLPNMCMIRMNKTGRKNGHLIAYCDGKFYDPWFGIFNSKEELLARWNATSNAKWRFDWYMGVYKNNQQVAGK